MTLPHEIDDIREWYPYDRSGPHAVPEKTFEFGLVLGGTVSAGAYTAGVLDFLIEALDCWHQEKERAQANDDTMVPRHHVKLRIITGASGGGVCGAIFAASCRHRFPPVKQVGTQTRISDRNPSVQSNPFYRTWVKTLDIGPLLEMSDIQADKPLKSLLNCRLLDDFSGFLVEYPRSLSPAGTHGLPMASAALRSWLEPHLKLAMTVTNLRGMPYSLTFPGDAGIDHAMRLHQDFMEFSVPTPGSDVPEYADPAPNFRTLEVDTDQILRSGDERERFRASALATGAFPFALEARDLSKQPIDYCYRFVTWLDKSMGSYVYGKPSPRDGMDDPYRFLAVDGGTLNNEPFEYARQALAGTNGRNPRSGLEANRAIVLIDPLNEPTAGQSTDEPKGEIGEAWENQAKIALATYHSLRGHAKFRPDEIGLMQDPTVYSRWMIAPKRGDTVSNKAIATSGLGAFLGFFSEAYRHHDFMLGRRNCQRFLRAHFGLPMDNNAIHHKEQRLLNPDKPNHSPIIPLYGSAADDAELCPWPSKVLAGADAFEDPIKRRMRAIYGKLKRQEIENFGMKAWLDIGWVLGGRSKLTKAVLKQINKAIDEVEAGPPSH
ncbi:patatin-like phospholipase family protein [Eilatimonas milleporae]|uniref:Patatin-like phospholipase n=1 Tax=Eilatimonas milleporae TaxID=911205 RepID=A0A3M0CTD4_9PROT|nr:patatin-like phospholipase family protein [Eilatimonas milleporae]RMB12297.1 patatin-like phospholipase [Eilatimonas milleporae]